MATDKITELLIEALKQALAEPDEQRLYRSGKLSGLFASRAGASAEAATKALREGLLEITHTEAKGKTLIEWVRLTPKGVNFLHDRESPVKVLRELQETLQTTREGMPLWVKQMKDQIRALEVRLADDAQRVLHRLDALSQRVDEALQRTAAAQPRLPNGMAAAVPWALDALTYLDRRQSGNANGRCPLPELFAAMREQHSELSVASFHDGLRRLNDRGALRLLPFDNPPELMSEPEYALPEGASVLYYASR